MDTREDQRTNSCVFHISETRAPWSTIGLCPILSIGVMPAYTRKVETSVPSLLRTRLPTIFGASVLISGFVVSIWIGQ